MSVEGKKFKVIQPDITHVDAAVTVSQWVSQDGKMLPKSPEQVLELFGEGRAVLAVDGEEVIGHAAATFINSDKSIEIGALYTEANHRGRGIAHETTTRIVDTMREVYPGSLIYALANESSAPLFVGMGAREMSTDELPGEVWDACKDCPRLPEQVDGCPFKCCDTPYDLTNLPKK